MLQPVRSFITASALLPTALAICLPTRNAAVNVRARESRSVTGEECRSVPVLSQNPSCFTRRRKSGPASKVQGPGPAALKSPDCRRLQEMPLPAARHPGCPFPPFSCDLDVPAHARTCSSHIQAYQPAPCKVLLAIYVDPEQQIITSLNALRHREELRQKPSVDFGELVDLP